MPEITLTVNGDRRTIPGPATLADLLRRLDLDPRMVVVERNRSIVRKDALPDTPVADGDVIEIVHFVGGG